MYKYTASSEYMNIYRELLMGDPQVNSGLNTNITERLGWIKWATPYQETSIEVSPQVARSTIGIATYLWQ